MAAGKITAVGRRKLCMAHAGDISLPRIMYMAVGDGGLDGEGNPVEITGEEVSLSHELLRKEITTHTYPEETTCRYGMRLGKEELAGEHISEMGLFDGEGELVAYKNFLPKGKDSDMEFAFELDEIF